MEVEKIIGRGSGFVAVEIPFTPRAKRVLELSLEEARQLGTRTYRAYIFHRLCLTLTTPPMPKLVEEHRMHCKSCVLHWCCISISAGSLLVQLQFCVWPTLPSAW